MAAVKQRSAKAHERAVSIEISEIALFLRENLGRKLLAVITGVTNRTIDRWASGEDAPRDDSERRLRATYQVFHTIASDEAAPTVRAWFMGMNPQLDDESPAEALSEDRLREVMAAARAFVAGG